MANKKAVGAPKREPNKDEKKAGEDAFHRVNARTERLSLVVQDRGNLNISIEGALSDELTTSNLLYDTFASRSSGWVNHSLARLVNQSRENGADVESQAVNAAAAFIAAIAPEDELEAALAQQMFAAHDLAMTMAYKAKQTNSADALSAFSNIATKMMRTFSTQLEALGKHRRGGEQIVRHVHVDARNSQNIIAESVTTGGPNGKIAEQSYEQGAFSPTLLGADTSGYGVPIASTEGQEAVPATRR